MDHVSILDCGYWSTITTLVLKSLNYWKNRERLCDKVLQEFFQIICNLAHHVWESFVNIFWCNFSEVSVTPAKMAEVPSSNSVGVLHPTRPPSIVSAPPHPPSSAVTSAWVGGSRIGSKTSSRRSYEQIILDSSTNILIRITIQKITNSEKPDDKPRSLSTPEVGELIFDYLEIDPADCLELDLTTGGRYDTKELLVKAGAKLGKALTTEPLEFRQHKVNISVSSVLSTKKIR